jgi:uncharacterized membrane protein
MTGSRRKLRRLALLRIVRGRPRLFICGAISVVVTALFAFLTNRRPATRLLAGWDIGVALYLAFVVQMMRRSNIRRLRRRAAQQDEGQFTILVLTVAAALASLAAIFVHFGSSAVNGSRQPISLTPPALTILLSWAFIHTMRESPAGKLSCSSPTSCLAALPVGTFTPGRNSSTSWKGPSLWSPTASRP